MNRKEIKTNCTWSLIFYNTNNNINNNNNNNNTNNNNNNNKNEYDQVKLLWDFRIQTDHHLDHNRLDICSRTGKGEQSVPNHRCGMSF